MKMNWEKLKANISNFRFSSFIQPAILPERGELLGSYAIATGWGDTRENGRHSNVLQEIRLPIWSNINCASKYGEEDEKIYDTMFCAGSEGKDTCQVSNL